MLKKLLCCWLFGIPFCLFGQPDAYKSLVREADSLYRLKQYDFAASRYTAAFQSFQWKGIVTDRFNAARCWASLDVPDSAFFQLERITDKGNFSDEGLLGDSAFVRLKSSPRWDPMLAKVRKNAGIDMAHYNADLFQLIYARKQEDQKWRNRLTELENAAVPDSVELKKASRAMNQTDSVNYTILKDIIDRYGYPDYDLVGMQGAHYWWLLMQHQDAYPHFQEQVLGLMKTAVAQNRASSKDFAYLLDRVLINTSRLQVYGTQMELNPEHTSYIPKPVEHPEDLNERRKSVGLPPIELYIEQMNQRHFGTLKKR